MKGLGRRVSALKSRSNQPSEAEEREARELVSFITDAELAEMIAELEGGASYTIEELARQVGPVHDCSYRERARIIFRGQPELLAKCRERLAAKRGGAARP